MTTPTPTTEPSRIRAGVTWAWTRELADYPASTWTLKYHLKQLAASGAKYSITAGAAGDVHSVSVDADTTAAYTAGIYSWAAQVSAGGEVYEVDRGTLEILPRYDTDVAVDDRSHARTVLDAIEAVIENRATKKQEEYSIGGRSLKRTPIADLLLLRDRYRAEVFAEEQAEAAANGKRVGVWQARL